MINNNIGSFQVDQLKEIINIGASHASTALSQMVDKKVNITVPNAYIDKIENVSKLIERRDEKVTAALLKIYGDANGVMFLMFGEGCDIKLGRLLTKNLKDDDKGVLSDIEISAIKEVGNVLAGAALTAFSRFLDMNLIHSVSNVAIDTVGSIVNSIAAEVGKTTGEALIFDVDFVIKSEQIETHLFFFIDPIATDKILKAIEKKYLSN